MNLTDWNRVLVAAVFGDDGLASPEIRSIDATDGFLSRASGLKDPADARRSFLAAMPKTQLRVRRLFDCSAAAGWSAGSKTPPFYAQLHLTIMAASADEGLCDEGNFRHRLSQMLQLPVSDYVSGGCLPRLWELAQDWSERRAAGGHAIRRLILPDPGAETIIGYSKRLAFPGFSDQNRLADLLRDEDVDASAPVTRLIRVLKAHLARFSERFGGEFRTWLSCWEMGDREGALRSPFWAALQETTWRREREQDDPSGCRMEIDPTEPCDSGIWLYGPRVVQPDATWRFDRDDRLADDRLRWRHHADDQAGSFLDVLRNLASRRDRPLGQRFSRSLTQGCLLFAQDESGRWFDVPSFPEGGKVWLIFSDTNAWSPGLPQAMEERESVYRVRLIGTGRWSILGPLTATEKLRDWFARQAPETDAFAPRLRRARLHVLDAIRLDDGAYLWLPPIVPSFRCEGASAGAVTLMDDAPGDALALLLSNDDRLILPPGLQNPPAAACRLRIEVYGQRGLPLAKASFQFQRTTGALGFKSVRDPTKWLESSAEGRLDSYMADWLDGIWPGSLNARAESSTTTRDVRDGASSERPQPFVIEPRDIDERWWRTVEILSGVFARRAAWPIAACFEFLRLIWGTRRAAWTCLDDLIDNALVRVLHARHWSHQVVVPVHPLLVYTPSEEQAEIRLCGLTSTAIRARVSTAIGTICQVFAAPDRSIAGACVWWTSANEVCATLRTDTHFPLVDRASVRAPMLPPFDHLMSRAVRTDVDGYDENKKSIWSTLAGGFRAGGTGWAKQPRLERWRSDGQQDLYVLTHRDGTRWNTDCRRMALLALHVERGVMLGETQEDGSVVLSDASLALPSPLSRANVALGGGVCHRRNDGTRAYPAGPDWSLAAACADWLAPPLPPPPAGIEQNSHSHHRFALALRRLAHRRASRLPVGA
jgi:hypothetical protein